MSLLAGGWCWHVWQSAAANSASPGAIILLLGVGFFGLLGAMGFARTVLMIWRGK